jgi:hypothetical protein
MPSEEPLLHDCYIEMPDGHRVYLASDYLAWPEERKRRDSNPRTLSGLSLSRSSTDSSERITPAVSAGQQPRPVLGEYRRPGANATRIATGVGRNHAVRAIVLYPRTCFSTIDCCNCARQQTGETPAWLGESRGGCDTVAGARMNGGLRPLVGTCSLSTVAAGWPAIVRGQPVLCCNSSRCQSASFLSG